MARLPGLAHTTCRARKLATDWGCLRANACRSTQEWRRTSSRTLRWSPPANAQVGALSPPDRQLGGLSGEHMGGLASRSTLPRSRDRLRAKGLHASPAPPAATYSPGASEPCPVGAAWAGRSAVPPFRRLLWCKPDPACTIHRLPWVRPDPALPIYPHSRGCSPDPLFTPSSALPTLCNAPIDRSPRGCRPDAAGGGADGPAACCRHGGQPPALPRPAVLLPGWGGVGAGARGLPGHAGGVCVCVRVDRWRERTVGFE